MSTRIRFYVPARPIEGTPEREIGTVTVNDDGTLDCPDLLHDLVGQQMRRGGAVGFIARYGSPSWSNGYVSSRRL